MSVSDALGGHAHPLQAHSLPSDVHPLIPRGDLENGEPGLGEGIKIAPGLAIGESVVVAAE